LNKAHILLRRKKLTALLTADGATGQLSERRANFIAGALRELDELEKMIAKENQALAETFESPEKK